MPISFKILYCHSTKAAMKQKSIYSEIKYLVHCLFNCINNLHLEFHNDISITF